ncbi:hypothetical protein RvY_02245-2 [Ramazzottius varieornatus]|uniref:Somatostatin/Cortistatin C-terminal domain-containing protein n=1 Tax=Ramazzottius varieornatus TaxID=947166 RepID=A0A1D1UPZ4_RAMVA|nr:hypothetical protein RvY_02245-2 [Ramazzottius varieornatus]
MSSRAKSLWCLTFFCLLVTGHILQHCQGAHLRAADLSAFQNSEILHTKHKRDISPARSANDEVEEEEDSQELPGNPYPAHITPTRACVRSYGTRGSGC